MFSVIKSGGLLMIPIVLCGIIATFIIIERCYFLYVTKKRDEKLKREVSDSLRSKNFTAIGASCVSAGTPTAQVVKKIMDNLSLSKADLKELAFAEMDLVAPLYEHFLVPLGTIANISTLLGLLGTVTGNIRAFGVLGAGGSMGDPSVLAGAIAEALVTTAAGLAVSIPALIFHNYFVSRVDRNLTSMESSVTSILLELHSSEK